MDFDTLRDEVRERLGELEEDFFLDVEVDRAINEAIKRFSAEERWEWLFTEATDTLPEATDELDLPLNVGPNRVFNISVSGGSLGTVSGRILEKVLPTEGFRLRHLWDPRTSSPRWYYITSAFSDAAGTTYTARFIPVPDADYDIEYQYLAVPDDLSGATDEPQIPLEYQEAIPAWAAGKLFLKEFSISQKANEQFALYAKVLQQARKDMKEFDYDETVAWGRHQPVYRYDYKDRAVRNRIPPTLGP